MQLICTGLVYPRPSSYVRQVVIELRALY